MPNGGVATYADVPRLAFESFREVLATPASGGRLAALFGVPEDPERLRLIAVLARDREHALSLVSTTVGNSYSALTPANPQAHLFEREIAEQWGVRPEGHPWLKPVRFHRSYRAGHDAWGRGPEAAILAGSMEFFEVQGEEIHEVAVGPVHAGVIEPGHFRFQCHGERVIHLEISLGYQHRGIERALSGGLNKRTIHLIEAAAGDTAVGHAIAHAQIIESLAGVEAPPRGQALRAVALELERLANHSGDLGALAGDVGYLPTASFCGRLRGDFLNMTMATCGNRLGLGWIRPGGVAVDPEPEDARRVAEALGRSLADLESAFNLIRKNPTVRARFEETGALSAACEEVGVVGVVARACGIERDVRRDHPQGTYRDAEIPIATWPSGDVFARARVRWLESSYSAPYAARLLKALPPGPARVETGPLAPDRIAVSLVEGWRGEICHIALTGGRGELRQYKIVDPSFHNWMALAVAMRNQRVSDFPLCNKSFNLSYSGHDL
jgi:Ni,Fe-hydrogenase III large subunit